MARRMKLVTESAGTLTIEIVEGKNPRTASAVWEALPIESRAQRWGDEVYFEIPVSVELEDPQVEVEVGDVAYWPMGRCMCVFFGRTPASKGDEPKAYSPVNVFGKVVGDAKILKAVKEGEKIKVERAT